MQALKLLIGFQILILFSCQQQRKLYQLYKLEDFNLKHAIDFVHKIEELPEIQVISIIDTRADGNDFKVNNQNIFIDTTLNDRPNYYNYRKRATELNVHKDSLLYALKTFYKIGVNEFNRDDNYFRFQVNVGFTTEKGYVYIKTANFQTGDTLPATSVRNSSFHFKVVLAKQVDKSWFEYYAIK